ncbi:MAG: extracellular solute-binding protein [Lachnospiraceae bacterium]|nr:extracellular solute-binding protein [Lachnospiraceae bacterium]
MKEGLKKLTAFVLVLCFGVGMTGCGKGDGQEDARKKNEHMEIAENRLYGFQSIQPEGMVGNLSTFALGPDRIYVSTIDDSAMTEQDREDMGPDKFVTRLYFCDLDGTDVKEIDLQDLPGDDIQYMAYGGDDSLVMVIEQRNADGKMEDTWLVRMDADGNVIKQESIGKNLHEAYAMYRMIQDREGRVYLCYMDNFYLFDADLTFVKEVKPDFDANSIGLTKDGRVICSGADSPEAFVCELDFETGEFGKRYMTGTDQVGFAETYLEDDPYDFYFSNSYGCYGYNMEQELSTYLFDYEMSDLLWDDFLGMQTLGNGQFIAIDWKDSRQFDLLTQQDMSERERKTVITYGVTNLFMNDNVQEMIVKFNQSNEDYRIELRNYSEEEDPQMAFNLDVLSGNMPDIIDLNGLPADQYISKGLLEDLTPYFENDTEIHTEDFIDSVIEAMKVDGKIYYAAPNFEVHSVVAKKEDVEALDGITISEIKDILEKKGEKAKPFNTEEKVYMLFTFLGAGYSDFIDWENGTCHFDSQEFRDILEICDRKSSETEYLWGEGWGLPQLLRDGIVLFDDSSITCRELQLYRGLYDSDIALIGYPSESRDGSYFSFHNRMGIYSESENKDVAWEFIRTWLTKEYQGNMYLQGEDNLPTRKDAFELYLKIETATEDFVDEFGNKWFGDRHGVSGVDGVDVYMKAATDEDVKLLRDLIDKTHKTVEENPAVDEIIEDEVKAYFAGFQSVDKTVVHIQDRVGTYVNEAR